jgi:hypothetical protein
MGLKRVREAALVRKSVLSDDNLENRNPPHGSSPSAGRYAFSYPSEQFASFTKRIFRNQMPEWILRSTNTQNPYKPERKEHKFKQEG